MPRRRSSNRQTEDDHEFETGSSGASLTYPVQCSSLRKNGHAIIQGKPCKIVDMFTSQPGKHGHTKIHLVGIDIFTGKRYEDVSPSGTNVDVPNVKRSEMQVVNLDRDGYFTFMEENGSLNSSLRHMETCAQSLDEVRALKSKADDNDLVLMCTVVAAMGHEMVKDVKIGK